MITILYPMTDPYVCHDHGLPFAINIPQSCWHIYIYHTYGSVMANWWVISLNIMLCPHDIIYIIISHCGKPQLSHIIPMISFIVLHDLGFLQAATSSSSSTVSSHKWLTWSSFNGIGVGWRWEDLWRIIYTDYNIISYSITQLDIV